MQKCNFPIYPRVKLLFPPGGFETLDVGRSVSTLYELVVLDEANALLETPFRLPAGTAVGTTGFSGAVSLTTGSGALSLVGSGVGAFSLVEAFVSFSVPREAFTAAGLFLASRLWRMRSNSASVYPPMEIWQVPPGRFKTRLDKQEKKSTTMRFVSTGNAI